MKDKILNSLAVLIVLATIIIPSGRLLWAHPVEIVAGLTVLAGVGLILWAVWRCLDMFFGYR